jgi:hypothetical protein
MKCLLTLPDSMEAIASKPSERWRCGSWAKFDVGTADVGVTARVPAKEPKAMDDTGCADSALPERPRGTAETAQ